MSHPNALILVTKQRQRDLLNEAQKQRAITESRARPALHATVIGSGVAGLVAARALVDEVERVTILDRDALAGSAAYRPGVPQARHAHTLLPSGQVILEALFPDLVDELLDRGAVAIDPGRDIAFYHAGAWHTPRSRPTQVSLGVSRPLLEATLYQRLANHPKVRVLKGYEAIGLTADERGARVTGVRLRDRQGAGLVKTKLPTDLIVDASGRTSKAAQWLADLGYATPEETVVNAFAGYASRLYRRPADFSADWKYLYIRPSAPDQSRGGVIIPMEGDRWHVTLFGLARDYPSTDEAGFLAFARSLPTGQLYEAIRTAEPLSKPYGYRRTENRLRHYDRLPRYLEGFLVFGDAAYTLNPVYALGMTAAALGSQALRESLQDSVRRQNGDLAGLAQRFQRRLRRAIARPLKLTLTEDKRWPATEVSETVRSAGPHRAAQHIYATAA